MPALYCKTEKRFDREQITDFHFTMIAGIFCFVLAKCFSENLDFSKKVSPIAVPNVLIISILKKIRFQFAYRFYTWANTNEI